MTRVVVKKKIFKTNFSSSPSSKTCWSIHLYKKKIWLTFIKKVHFKRFLFGRWEWKSLSFFSFFSKFNVRTHARRAVRFKLIYSIWDIRYVCLLPPPENARKEKFKNFELKAMKTSKSNLGKSLTAHIQTKCITHLHHS